MKLVLFNDYRLGVLQNGNVVEVMASLDSLHFHKPQEMVEGLILGWDQMKPKIEHVIQGKEGVPISEVTLRAPIPRPPKLICAAVNYLEFGQRKPAILDAFLKAPTAIFSTGETCELPPVPASIFHHEPG